MKNLIKLFSLLTVLLAIFLSTGCKSKSIELPKQSDITEKQEDVNGEASLTESKDSPSCTHNYTEKVLIAATCQKEGLAKKTCSLCGKTQSATIPKAAHAEVADAAIPATCTSEGKTEGKHCSVCGTVTVAQETVAALGHTEVTDAAIPATCTSEGKTEGKHCSVCKEILVAQETIAALGHTEVIDEGIPATCTSAGISEGKHCSVCDTILVRQEATNPIPHTTEKIVITPVSCKENGKIANKCTMCKSVIGDLETVEKGHFPAGHAHTEIEGLCSVSTKGYCNNCENYLIEPGVYTASSFDSCSWCGTVQFKFEYYNTLNVKVTANQIVRTYNYGYFEKFGDAVVYDYENNIEQQYDPVITITEENFAVVDKNFYDMFLQRFEQGEYTLSGTYEFGDNYYIALRCPEGITNLNFKYLDKENNACYSSFIQMVESSDGPIINYSNYGKVMYFSYQSEWGCFDDSKLQRYVIVETPQKVSKEFFEWFTSVATKVVT